MSLQTEVLRLFRQNFLKVTKEFFATPRFELDEKVRKLREKFDLFIRLLRQG